jgi:hypothetical protein
MSHSLFIAGNIMRAMTQGPRKRRITPRQAILVAQVSACFEGRPASGNLAKALYFVRQRSSGWDHVATCKGTTRGREVSLSAFGVDLWAAKLAANGRFPVETLRVLCLSEADVANVAIGSSGTRSFSIPGCAAGLGLRCPWGRCHPPLVHVRYSAPCVAHVGMDQKPFGRRGIVFADDFVGGIAIAAAWSLQPAHQYNSLIPMDAVPR